MTDGSGVAVRQEVLHGSFTVQRDLAASPKRVSAGGAEEALSYRSTFWDVSADSRIVFSYSVTVNGVRRWASLVTVSLAARPDGDGTWLRHTEQYAFLAYDGDGAQDVAHLKGSMPLQLNALEVALNAAG